MEEKEIKQLMNERGYSLHGTINHFKRNQPSVSIYNFTKHVEIGEHTIILHASVSKQMGLELSFVGLKMFMTLQTGWISINHAEFEKFEAVLTHYAFNCLENPPF